MIVTRPQSQQEPDLLAGNEFAMLVFKDSEGGIMYEYPPPATGWTHGRLEAVAAEVTQHARWAWEAWLNGRWVGSSEV